MNLNFVWPNKALTIGSCQDRNYPDEQWTYYVKSSGMGEKGNVEYITHVYIGLLLTSEVFPSSVRL